MNITSSLSHSLIPWERLLPESIARECALNVILSVPSAKRGWGVKSFSQLINIG